MAMMKLQPELFYKTAAIRKIKEIMLPLEERTSANDLFEFDSREPRIRKIYAVVRSIDRGIANGKIQKVTGAIKNRKMNLGKMINMMVRSNTIDMNILQQEQITVAELVEKYYEQEARTLFIEETLKKYPFISKHIENLAVNGEPYSTKNAKQISVYEEKIRQHPENGRPNPPSLLLNTYKEHVKKLKKADEQGEQYYPVENLCYLLLHERDRGGYKLKHDPFWSNNLNKFSPTSLERLLKLIVQQYRKEYADEIQEFNDARNKNKKNGKRRKKILTTDEKKELVQRLKHSGMRQIDVINSVDFSPSTVKRLWL